MVLVLYVMTAIVYVIRWRIGNQCNQCLCNSVALTERIILASVFCATCSLLTLVADVPCSSALA